MIDIHCHILPELDDGPKSLNESVRMSEIAALDGITHVVATPHVKGGALGAAEIAAAVVRLRTRLKQDGIPLEILQGADLSYNVEAPLAGDFTLNRAGYVLIEFPHTHIPSNAGNIIFALALKGLKPIISHPERNLSVLENPEVLAGLLGMGALSQITADSLTGELGADTRQCAAYLLANGMAHFLATDAHSSQWRKPVLSEGFKAAVKLLGRKKALALVLGNPAAVLAGEPIDSEHDAPDSGDLDA